MIRSVLWIFLATAPLVSAGSLDGFQATCSLSPGNEYGGCGGTFDSSFSFGGPFVPGTQVAPGLTTLAIEFDVGTSGGAFTYMGHTCDYDITLGGSQCDGEIELGSPLLAPPAGTGLPLGAVINVVGLSPAEGFYCDPCYGNPALTNPIFDLQVLTTYQFTVTAPGTQYPFAWTGAEFASVPEPATWAFAILGFVGVAALSGGRRRDNRARN